MEIKNAFYAFLVGATLAGTTAASKAYIDVERLKTKVETMIDLIKETREDIKDVKRYLLHRRVENE